MTKSVLNKSGACIYKKQGESVIITKISKAAEVIDNFFGYSRYIENKKKQEVARKQQDEIYREEHTTYFDNKKVLSIESTESYNECPAAGFNFRCKNTFYVINMEENIRWSFRSDQNGELDVCNDIDLVRSRLVGNRILSIFEDNRGISLTKTIITYVREKDNETCELTIYSGKYLTTGGTNGSKFHTRF